MNDAILPLFERELREYRIYNERTQRFWSDSAKLTTAQVAKLNDKFKSAKCGHMKWVEPHTIPATAAK